MQFKALLIDAYRQLSAAKLFWVTVGISALVVVSFGSISFNTEGISIGFGAYQIESEQLREGSPWARGLYIGIFSSLLVNIWLAWIATILALISTCSIFPEFVHSGSIELTISKPIGRLKLFFSKYLVSLLFVIMQVAIFCTGIFFCVGFRIGEWNPMIFAAIPVVATFFSYLFAICVLIGIVTRSGITALLITGVFWMLLWTIQTSETILNRFVTQQIVDIERFDEGIITATEELDKIKSVSSEDIRISKLEKRIESFQDNSEEAAELLAELNMWHTPTSWVLALSPKTAQTIGLLDRWLSDPDGFDIAAIMSGDMREFEGEELEEFDPTTRNARERETMRRMRDDYENRPLFYVIGTSLLFEGFILGLASWYFCRKDF
ncbi:MAG: ABC transporter permease subunit [Phycisphaerae bacterium]|jgi:ABC-type transport system involved in multi-copper enzyme maturation permease subunit|nr:ABC transporter permease subunit [Phycisphaerae bacterium]MBT5366219.1 ABC transporter permease subunit [Phycisphaerae bacterium]MBT6269339.1 ABC transporter permease subunit [Phycisphaerae bacterium]MBT6282675.1 ABC transporter permease subunit [Phycisphaerae bacterium]